MTTRLNQVERRAYIYLIAAVALIFVPILYQFIFRITFTDYPTHHKAIVKMAETGDLLLSHFLYHIVVGVIWKLLSLPLSGVLPSPLAQVNVAGLITEFLIYAFLAAVIYQLLQRAVQQNTALQSAPTWRPAIATTLGLMVLGPVLLLWPIDRSKYLGYIATNAYHNPTMPALKPIAVLLFVCVAAAFLEYSDRKYSNREYSGAGATASPEKISRRRTWAIAAILTALSALAKPSYIICLLPALLIYAVYRRLRGHHVDFALIGWGVVLPTFLMLGWQYLFTYETGGTGVLFLPLAAMSAHSYLYYLPPKFFFSILFPMVVYLLFFARARRDTTLNLAWCVFAVAAFYSYFLAEAGRVGHGNFIWSGQIALFVLFIQSMIFLVRETAVFTPVASLRSFFTTDRRLMWCLLAFGAHVASGVYYYVYLMTIDPTMTNPYG